MRRFFNFCLLVVLLTAIGYVLWRADLLPFKLGGNSGSGLPPVTAKARDTLRVAVADRPERLLIAALDKLLEVKSQKLEVVEYNPETVWLELSAGEIDLVVAPLGEAVKAQGRFHAGRFLFTSGLSEGLDQLRALKEGTPESVGVTARSGQELYALQNFPESKITLAKSHQQLEGWLLEGAVKSAVLQSAALSKETSKASVILAQTSAEKPEPTVVVLSRVFEAGATEIDLSARVEVLNEALKSWKGLVDYLETQPELLRSNLKNEAEKFQLDVDLVLSDYRFLTPAYGRAVLVQEQSAGLLQQTLDLLVLANVPNLTAPDWPNVLRVPDSLAAAFPNTQVEPSVEPSPEASLAPDSTPAPEASPTPKSTSRPEATPPRVRLRVPGTHHASGSAPPDVWPKETLKTSVQAPRRWPPALTSRTAVVTYGGLVRGIGLERASQKFLFKGAGKLAGPPLTDGSKFFVYNRTTIFCLDDEGTIKWNYNLPGEPTEELALAKPVLVVSTANGSGGGVVIALDTESGDVKWQVALPDPPTSAPCLAQGSQPAVVVADGGGKLRAWNAETGSVLWKVSLGDPIYITPSAYQGQVAVCEGLGRVRLYSVDDGSKTWDEDVGSSLTAPPTVTSDYVLIPAKDTYLYAYSRQDGELEWKVRLQSALSESPIVVGGRIFQSDEDGRMHVSDRDGNLISTETYGRGWLSAPAFSRRGWCMVDVNGTFLYYER